MVYLWAFELHRLLTQAGGQIEGTCIETSILSLDHVSQLVYTEAFVVVFGSNVVDKVLADRVPESGNALVLYIRLVEQLHRPTNVRTENVHGVASLTKGWI